MYRKFGREYRELYSTVKVSVGPIGFAIVRTQIPSLLNQWLRRDEPWIRPIWKREGCERPSRPSVHPAMTAASGRRLEDMATVVRSMISSRVGILMSVRRHWLMSFHGLRMCT